MVTMLQPGRKFALSRLAGSFVFATTLLLGAQLAAAAPFETPPSFKAGHMAGVAAQGAGYTMESPVASDGYLRNYVLNTPWGTVRASGDQMLRVRVKELAALEAMQKTTDSKSFGDALVKAGLSPVTFVGNMATNPVGTVKNTVNGVGQFFGGIASGIRNAGKSQDNTMASITGEAKQKRLIAFQYGIDPYTDLKPVQDKLEKLAGAAALGGLAVTAAFMVIPGAAGTIISEVSTAETLNGMVRDNSASQLMDINRKKLAAAGIHGNLAEKLLTNPAYTPVDMTVMADALTRLSRVQHIDVMVSYAIAASSRDNAYFIRKEIELTSAYQQRTGQLFGFVRLSNSPFPLATTTANGLVGVLPIDALSWTRTTGGALTGLSEAANAYGITGPKLLSITGTATPLARKNLLILGWTIEEGTMM
jgi:hypothetical protein